ncbi:MAG: hypothetical protein GY757_38625 [bacterium]|nr:hypothetical protein [bacterium]
MKTRRNSTGEVHHSGPGTASIKRIVFLFIFLVSLSVLSDELNAQYNLEFDSIEYPEQIVIPYHTSRESVLASAACAINYTFRGNVIAEGISGSTDCFYRIYRDCAFHAKIIYLDKNNNELVVSARPEKEEFLHFMDNFGFGLSAVFMDNKCYSADLFLFTSHGPQKKKINQLLREKKIKKVSIEINRVVVDWTYIYEELQTEKDDSGKRKCVTIDTTGKFYFDVGEKISIKVTYENEKK